MKIIQSVNKYNGEGISIHLQCVLGIVKTLQSDTKAV